MGLPQTPPEVLAERASFLRDSLSRSQSTTDHMVSKLSTFDHRLSYLHDAIRPVAVMASSMRRTHENIGKTLSTADSILSRYDVLRQAEEAMQNGTHNGLEGYLAVAHLLRSNIEFFATERHFRNSDGIVSRSRDLLTKATSKLQEEFRLILSSYSLDPENLPDYYSNFMEPQSEPLDSSQNGAAYCEHQAKDMDKLIHFPPEVLLLLHDVAQQLVLARCQMQCLKIYRDIRAPLLEKCLKKLGMEKLYKDATQNMQWGVLEARIRSWIRVVPIAVKFFFVEKRICYRIFKDIDFLSEKCFVEVSTNIVQQLIDFVEVITASNIMPEKLFALLDMYKTLQRFLLDMETIFDGEACSPLRTSIIIRKKDLSATIFETLTSFEKRISEEATKAPGDGRVHPMTSYVINYLKYLLDYLSVLKHISQDLNTGSNLNYQPETMMLKLLHALEINLEAKTKQCKDPALAHLFLMNNIHYMVSFVRGSEAMVVIGKDWIDKHRRVVQQNAIQYRRTAWAQVAITLSTQGLGSLGSDGINSGSALKDAVRDRFKSFNTQFEELHQRHCQWVVRDRELADNLRLSINEILLPAYRSFTQRFWGLIESTKNYDKFYKYSPESIERMVGELFQGGDR